MEEIHHVHKEAAWGWAMVLRDWRRSRTRARIRRPHRPATVFRR